MKNKKWIILIIALILLLGISAWIMFGPGKAEVITDTDCYLEKENFQGKSGLKLFPDEIDSVQSATYYYYYRDKFLDNSAQIYLRCIYSEEEFQKECDRLTQITVSYRGETHTPQYNIGDYKMPTYEAIRAADHCYEYALVDEKNHSIEYIFLQFIPAKNVVFSQDKLPAYYEDKGEKSYSYNIYAFPTEQFEEGRGYELVYY